MRGENFFLYLGAAILFGAGIYYVEGGAKAEEFFAGYLLEQSLSVDNLFVFILCFNFFKTPMQYQPKARKWRSGMFRDWKRWGWVGTYIETGMEKTAQLQRECLSVHC